MNNAVFCPYTCDLTLGTLSPLGLWVEIPGDDVIFGGDAQRGCWDPLH
jgi:hypothetical protein